jgi:hypothetical protein
VDDERRYFALIISYGKEFQRERCNPVGLGRQTRIRLFRSHSRTSKFDINRLPSTDSSVQQARAFVRKQEPSQYLLVFSLKKGGAKGRDRVMSALYGTQTCIAAKADYRREDFVFLRTQSRAMQNLPWEHSLKHARLPWITSARRERRARTLRNASLTVMALLLGALLVPTHHAAKQTAQIAAATPVHATILAANTTGL